MEQWTADAAAEFFNELGFGVAAVACRDTRIDGKAMRKLTKYPDNPKEIQGPELLGNRFSFLDAIENLPMAIGVQTRAVFSTGAVASTPHARSREEVRPSKRLR